MKFGEYKYLLLSDLYRLTGDAKATSLLRHAIAGEAFKYIFWMRTCRYTRNHSVLKFVLFPIARLMLNRLTYRLGLAIPYRTDIGSGFYIGHFGGIVVNGQCVIGKNCNLSHGVTLGQANRGSKRGFPVIGDNVYIGPGAKIVGAVTVGDNAAIGANCVVTNDVPPNAVVVGIPGRVISETEGSEGYVNRTDYDRVLTGWSPSSGGTASC